MSIFVLRFCLELVIYMLLIQILSLKTVCCPTAGCSSGVIFGEGSAVFCLMKNDYTNHRLLKKKKPPYRGRHCTKPLLKTESLSWHSWKFYFTLNSLLSLFGSKAKAIQKIVWVGTRGGIRLWAEAPWFSCRAPSLEPYCFPHCSGIKLHKTTVEKGSGLQSGFTFIICS